MLMVCLGLLRLLSLPIEHRVVETAIVNLFELQMCSCDNHVTLQAPAGLSLRGICVERSRYLGIFVG